LGLVLLLAACVGEIAPGPRPGALDSTPAQPTLFRLTRTQFQNSLVALFGDSLEVPTDLPADDRLYGLSSISSARQSISQLDAEKYEAAVYRAVEQVWSDASFRARLMGCSPTVPPEPCARTFVGRMATRAWRRPATSAEIDGLVGLDMQIAADLGDP